VQRAVHAVREHAIEQHGDEIPRRSHGDQSVLIRADRMME
jgi:hypothetical protein